MRRFIACISCIALAACGSEAPTSSVVSGPSAASSVEITQGQGQTVQVQQELPDSIRAVVRNDAGDPVAGSLVSFEVDGPSDCGMWAASTLESASDGRVQNALSMGTIADTRADVDCTFRVVHSEAGAPEPLIDSVEVRVEPGEITEVNRGLGKEGPGPLTLPTITEDEHGNPGLTRVVADSVYEVQGTVLGTAEARTISNVTGGEEAVVCYEAADSVITGGIAHGDNDRISFEVEGNRILDGTSWSESGGC